MFKLWLAFWGCSFLYQDIKLAQLHVQCKFSGRFLVSRKLLPIGITVPAILHGATCPGAARRGKAYGAARLRRGAARRADPPEVKNR